MQRQTIYQFDAAKVAEIYYKLITCRLREYDIIVAKLFQHKCTR